MQNRYQDGYRRLIILFIVLASSLLVTIGMRKLSGGAGLFEFLKQTPPLSHNGNDGSEVDKVTLQKKAPVKVSAVQNLIALSQEYAKIAKNVRPSVVNVDTTSTSYTRFRDRRGYIGSVPKNMKGQGSGVIVTKEGHIITNHHVIADKQRIIVTLSNEDKYEAKLIAFDPSIDIALIKIEAKGAVVPLKFGDSDKVREGHIVLGFGNPFGIGRSVTNGIVSARRSSRSDKQPSLFQTNVAINPGNSGGPLVNVLGEIVGINSSIFSSDRENPSFQGISFAIPSNLVKKTFLDLLKYKRPMRGFLGISGYDADSKYIRERYDYKNKGGVLVVEVTKGSPADKAGISKEDIITKYDEKIVSKGEDLVQMIQEAQIGKEVRIELWSNKKRKIVNAMIAAVDAGTALPPLPEITTQQAKKIMNNVGIRPINLGPSNVNGVRVREVFPNSLSDGKILPGDIIYQINKTPIYHVKHFYQVILSTVSSAKIQFFYIRGGKRYSVPVNLGRVTR